jgi:hypothetical protein
MSSLVENPIEDLEGLLARYAQQPEGRIWIPLSLFTFQNESVAVAVRPGPRRGEVVVTDEGQTVATVEDLGFELEAKSALTRDIQAIADRRGFHFHQDVFSRTVTPAEVPTAALHLAEVEIAVSALLQLRLITPSTNIFATKARQVLKRDLLPKAVERVHFGPAYGGRYKDGEFFCVADADRPIGVKVVTNSNNMRDAVIVGLMYENEPIELIALKNPKEQLGGPRVVQFTTLFAEHIYDKPEKLAAYLNKRLAG